MTEFKDALKAFYSVIKTFEGRQRFAFITGVSKFSKVSIFSDLNNLDDMTLDADVATLFGFTHEEVRKYYPDKLAELGKELGTDADGAFGEIVKMYDGYKFHPKAEPVINPVSLGMCFKKKELGNWWAMTATPTFLIDFFKEHPADVSSLEVSASEMNAFEPEKIKPVVLRLIGMNVGGEVRTAKGRIDLTIETDTDAYVIEVKRDSTPMKAISQIREQGYVDKFRLSGKPITLIGIAFSTKKRAISGTKIVREA